MPSLSAHFACANILVEKLNISNKEEFFRGTIYPDLMKNSHFKIQSKNGIFLVPSITKFLQKNAYQLTDFEKGYLVHLLLDKYYLENFAYKFGIEPFINGTVYNDYSLLSVKLLNDFNVDTTYAFNIIMSFDDTIDKNKLISMSSFLNLEDKHNDTKIINYNEFNSFITNISDTIYLEVLDIITKN